MRRDCSRRRDRRRVANAVTRGPFSRLPWGRCETKPSFSSNFANKHRIQAGAVVLSEHGAVPFHRLTLSAVAVFEDAREECGGGHTTLYRGLQLLLGSALRAHANAMLEPRRPTLCRRFTEQVLTAPRRRCPSTCPSCARACCCCTSAPAAAWSRQTTSPLEDQQAFAAQGGQPALE